MLLSICVCMCWGRTCTKVCLATKVIGILAKNTVECSAMYSSQEHFFPSFSYFFFFSFLHCQPEEFISSFLFQMCGLSPQTSLQQQNPFRPHEGFAATQVGVLPIQGLGDIADWHLVHCYRGNSKEGY